MEILCLVSCSTTLSSGYWECWVCQIDDQGFVCKWTLQWKTLQEWALTIMDSNSLPSVPPIVSTLSKPKDDVLTTLSSLSQLVNNAQNLAPLDLHALIMCTVEVGHEVKGVGGTCCGMQRKRGKCSECGRNTRYYCLTCPPTEQHKHEWCCPDDTSANKQMCHTQHKENRPITM